MNYKIITLQVLLNMPETQHVIITREDGSLESFPVDKNNPRYQQFLQTLDSEDNA
jgi:hypothetical protein